MLNFFMRLENNDLISIINSAISYANENGICFHEVAQNVIVYAENCVDENGIECKLVMGVSPLGEFHSFGDFYLNDFALWLDNGTMFDCSCVLYSFLLTKFGQEYVDALHQMEIDIPLESGTSR